MKKLRFIAPLAALVILAGVFALAGCSNMLAETSEGGATSAAPTGYGTVRVSLGAGAARTAMPTATFNHYEYWFAKDGAAAAQMTPVDGVFTLEAGDYTLLVKAFVTAGDTDLAADGTSAGFTISPGAVAATVTVALSPIVSAGTPGSLSFDLSYPADATLQTFTLTPILGSEPIDLTTGATAGSGTLTGARSVGAGYYFLQIALSKDGSSRTTGAREAVHIYQNLTTTLNYPFTDAEFKVNAAAPTITTQPQSPAAAYARNATAAELTVVASGSGAGSALSYQWYSNTSDSNSEGTSLGTEAQTASYTPLTTTAGTFYYYVVVKNAITDNGDGGNKSATLASNAVTVTVNQPVNAVEPEITAQPQPTTYEKDATVTSPLSVTVTQPSNGELSYEWFKNTTDSTTGGTSVATTETYTPSTANLGTLYYYVVVTNTLADNGDGGTKTATATSDTAAITIAIVSADGLTAYLATLPTGSASAPTTVPLSLALSNVWGAIKTALAVNKYVILDLSACTDNTIAGAFSPSGNNFNVIYNNTYIKGIILPSTLESIGDYAFSGCTALTSVSIPDSVTSIGDHAFNGCAALESVSIPDSVTSIVESAFEGCAALESVTIGSGVTSIQRYTFYGCTALTTVIFAEGSNIGTAWVDNAFPGNTSSTYTGTALWNAYHADTGGPGTYRRTDAAWAKD